MVALLILSAGYGYFVLRNRIELLKDKNRWLEQQLEATKEFRLDVVAQRLADRLRVLSEELERLNADHEASQESSRQKESELALVTGEIDDLKSQMESAEEILRVVSDRQLVCPHCEAPMAVHEFYPGYGEYKGIEIEFEHELIEYDCGFELRDGEIATMCPTVSSND